jgi:YidC/Oxa1 family membrane protein insertase
MEGIPFFEIFATGLAAIYGVVKSYGLAIILLTLVVRVILLPLSIKQTKSMREMQRIQPELKRIQQKFKNDRQKLTEAQMALYKEHGVNPFGGCAPLVLQFPVLIALYYVIREPLNYMDHLSGWALATDLRVNKLAVHEFLGLRLDCSAADVRAAQATDAVPGVVCGHGLVGVIPYLLLIGVMGLTTYLQQRQMQASQGAANPQAQQMQMLMRIMPVFLMVIGYSFPAALILYWSITNLWTIAQQRLMLQGIPQIGGDKGEAGNGKGEAKAPERPRSGATRRAAKPSGKSRPSGGDGHKAPATSTPGTRRRKKR